MTAAMKIRKGDVVHMLAGKDRGKQDASSMRARARARSSSRT